MGEGGREKNPVREGFRPRKLHGPLYFLDRLEHEFLLLPALRLRHGRPGCGRPRPLGLLPLPLNPQNRSVPSRRPRPGSLGRVSRASRERGASGVGGSVSARPRLSQPARSHLPPRAFLRVCLALRRPPLILSSLFLRSSPTALWPSAGALGPASVLAIRGVWERASGSRGVSKKHDGVGTAAR